MTSPKDADDRENSFDDVDVSDSSTETGEEDLYDPADLNEEEWEDEAGEGSQKGGKSPRKKSSSFTFLVIVCGVLVAGGFVYFQFSVPPSSAPAQSAEQKPQEVAEAPTAPPSSDVPLVSAEPAPAPMPSEPLTPMPDLGSEATQSSPSDEPPVSSQPEVVSSQVPSIEPSLTVDPVPVVPQKAEQPSDVSPPVPEVSSDDSSLPLSEPSSVSEPLKAKDQAPVPDSSDSLAQRLGLLEDKINQLSDHIQTGNPAAAALADIQSVSSQLSELSARLEVIEKALNERPSSVRYKNPVVEKAPQASTNSVPSAPTSSKKREKRTPKVVSSWELRAVSQGSAYIGKPGKSDLMAVRVGDVVEGIGTIDAIRQTSDGRWSIVGSKNTVNQ